MKLRKWDVYAYPIFIVISIKVFIIVMASGFRDGWEGNKFSLFHNLSVSDLIYIGLTVLLIIIASIKYHKQD